ncbi:MAG: hypothetical protein J2P32_18985, partial [Actinobacteria bacterium]|nr:hypothetical protein [Actinomycetota bacterium]
PGSADRKDAPDRDSTRAWREAVPHLQELWRKHEEKWPDASRPPADRSQDAPGSWRSDSGYPLDERDNRAVESEYQKVAQNENRITELMGDIEHASDGRLVGKEFRLKGEQRFKEKVAEQKRINPDASVSEIVSAVRDGIRYTIQHNEGEYKHGIVDDLRNIKAHGLELIRLRNSWSSTEYRGINSQWLDRRTGQAFEIQFHTPSSFEAKQLTHDAYERLRTLKGDSALELAETRELHDFQEIVCSKVSIPPNVRDIPDYP